MERVAKKIGKRPPGEWRRKRNHDYILYSIHRLTVQNATKSLVQKMLWKLKTFLTNCKVTWKRRTIFSNPSCSICIPPENVRKPEVLLLFQEVYKWNIGVKWVNSKNTLWDIWQEWAKQDQFLPSLQVFNPFTTSFTTIYLVN